LFCYGDCRIAAGKKPFVGQPGVEDKIDSLKSIRIEPVPPQNRFGEQALQCGKPELIAAIPLQHETNEAVT